MSSLPVGHGAQGPGHGGTWMLSPLSSVEHHLATPSSALRPELEHLHYENTYAGEFFDVWGATAHRLCSEKHSKAAARPHPQAAGMGEQGRGWPGPPDSRGPCSSGKG